MASTNICVTPSCGRPSTLLCPKCLELGIRSSFFCSQECFKKFWKTHKTVHLAASAIPSGDSLEDEAFAGYVFSGSLRPARKTPRRTLPDSIKRPDYAESGIPHSERKAKDDRAILILNDEEIEGMRITGRLAREVLEVAVNAVRVGITTDEIDRIVHEACIERDCYPSPLNYFNFPKSCCTSINEVICHGIPDMRPLENGDILNLDITTYHNDFHGDVNETIFVGQPDERSIRLVKNAYKCLAKSMDAVRPGVKYRDMGDVITKQATSEGFAVVRTYSGHGVHRLFHGPPNVPHYARNKAVGVMKPGHCFTIEPMINEGTWRDELWPDKWTAVTTDGLRSAQFEHTMLVLDPKDVEHSPLGMPLEVLTKRIIKGEDSFSAGLVLPDEDRLHYERYGRPYFVDQLHKLGLDSWITKDEAKTN
ncbi:Methionine aminopeptidase [Fasciola gigantica]|uniref:Methionine aminopeptidase n=1 Tax=Fasciola gigantica TaxID=46835 RepID=A0A504YL60_FASGI|nr:Methionine aminopeptidase [Fasciola gigantica]